MIETERLLLRHWRNEDAAALYKYASDRRVSEQALWPCHTSVAMSRDVIREFFEPNPHCFAIILKESDEPVGCIGLVPQCEEHYAVAESEREVGYWIGFPFWNKGLTTEALKAITAYCRNTLKLKSLLITTGDNNIASQRVAIKCGFAFIDDYKYRDLPNKAYRLIL